MHFPNEIWVTETLRYSQRQWPTDQRYIHESRVPISCGGTMKENDSNALARAQERDSVRILEDDRFTREQIRNNNATTTVLTSGSAEEKEIIGLGPNLAKLKGITSGRCSKHGTFAGDNCQECYKEICLTSGNAETTQDRLDKYSQAEFTDKIRKLRKRVAELEAKSVCHWTWNKEDSVFDTQCGNRAPFKERYCQYCGAALANALPSGRCSKYGAFEGSNCQECLKEICLTSGSAEIQCPIKDLGDVT
jgi:hypothetical protein